jgi:ubiquinone biosynthesis monooxygenase Coq7
MPAMEERQLTPVDRLLAGVDSFLKTVTATPTHGARENPAKDIDDPPLSTSEKTHAASLMRVNHAGEIAAQGLYQGHAAVARDPTIEDQMQRAAAEELDHLAWCEQRLKELGSGPSRLNPVWYGGAFLMGAASGVLGDRWSLGFIEETERQVVQHLTGHLDRLPANDARSRAIVQQMRDEEALHGANARDAGAAELPERIRRLMRLTAKIMTETAYWL